MSFTTKEILAGPDSALKRAVLAGLRVRPAAKVAAPARFAHHVTGQMNGVESLYAQHLDVMKAAGEVLDWKFEAVRLRLAKRTIYVPDFVVWLTGIGLEVHEVKGRKGDGYYCTDKGKLKVKLAGEMFVMPVCIVWPLKGGGWGREDFGRVPGAAERGETR